MRENMSQLALARSAKLLEELIRKREELGMTQPELLCPMRRKPP
jgi:hypothetical protein